MLSGKLFSNKKDFELDYIYDWVTVKNNTNVLKGNNSLNVNGQNKFKKDENIDNRLKLENKKLEA